MAVTMPEDATKARILRVAAELFARNGYHATGVAELCDAVRLGRGALYYHIGNKENLLFEISRAQVVALIEGAIPVVEGGERPTEKFRVLARELMRNIANNRAEWAVFFREFTALTGSRRTEILTARDTYEGLWARVVMEGVAAKEFRETDPILVKGVLGMFNYSYLWLRPQGRLRPHEVADIFAETALNGIRAKER